MKLLQQSNQIQLEENDFPKKFKKITGTRFANCIGLSPWQTPFQVWCEVTKTYEPPFKDSKYTVAGKIIEPKQLAFVNKKYFFGKVVTPEDVYGKDFFNKTYGDFYHDEPIFGGMWDSLVRSAGKTKRVIECKTTMRAEDWAGDVPTYYALQASRYATLLGIDDVTMVCTFLEDKDYPIENADGTFNTAPTEKFEVTSDNTIVVSFKVSEKFPNFMELEAQAREFYDNHILTGLSPVFDKVKDKEYLDAILNKCVEADATTDSLIQEYETLRIELDQVDSKYKDKRDRLEKLKEEIKENLISTMGDDAKKVETKTSRYTYSVTKSSRSGGCDTNALKRDGLYEKYLKPSTTTYAIKIDVIKEEKK